MWGARGRARGACPRPPAAGQPGWRGQTRPPWGPDSRGSGRSFVTADFVLCDAHARRREAPRRVLGRGRVSAEPGGSPAPPASPHIPRTGTAWEHCPGRGPGTGPALRQWRAGGAGAEEAQRVVFVPQKMREETVVPQTAREGEGGMSVLTAPSALTAGGRAVTSGPEASRLHGPRGA